MNDDGKLYMIEAFFDDWRARIQRLQAMRDQGLIEESVTLVLCYLAALANYRFPELGTEWKRFARLILEYADPELASLFGKVSTVALRAGHEHKKPFHERDYGVMCELLVERFGETPSVSEEPDKPRLLAILRASGAGLDLRNVSANLDRYTYAGLLYLRLRYAGVHRGSISHTYDVERDLAVMRLGPRSELIYYAYPSEAPRFSDEAVFRVLSHVHKNLSDACTDNVCWPQELDSS